MRSLTLCSSSAIVLMVIVASSSLAQEDRKTPQDIADELKNQVYSILHRRCSTCHGEVDPQSGLNLLDHEQAQSLADDILIRIRKPSADKHRMPRVGFPLTLDDVQILRRWIDGGAPEWDEAARPPRNEFNLTHKYVLLAIRDFFQNPPQEIRNAVNPEKDYRFFSTHHLLANGATKEDLNEHELALTKALNHLSLSPQPVKIIPIRPKENPAEVDTVFAVEITVPGWSQAVFFQKTHKSVARTKDNLFNVFDLILLEYPYGVFPAENDQLDRTIKGFLDKSNQVRDIPYLRADWFVATALVAPLYHDLLNLPIKVEFLEKRLLATSVQEQRGQHADLGFTFAAGMMFSNVSIHNRAVERFVSRDGYYWVSSDYVNSKAQQNLFRDPLNLEPVGGEYIFSLPNGLQGYLIADAAGNRLDAAPAEIVTDNTSPDRIVKTGLSCVRCHDQGMHYFRDVVRPSFERIGNVGLRQDVLQRFASQAVANATVETDIKRFTNALTTIGVNVPREPVTGVSNRYLYDPVDVATAAVEADVPEAFLENIVKLDQFVGLGLGSLLEPPQGGPKIPGAIQRDAWENYFADVVGEIGRGTPIPPIDGLTQPDVGAIPEGVSINVNAKNGVMLIVGGAGRAYIEVIGIRGNGEINTLSDVLPVGRGIDSVEFSRINEFATISVYLSEERFDAGEDIEAAFPDNDTFVVLDRFVHRGRVLPTAKRSFSF